MASKDDAKRGISGAHGNGRGPARRRGPGQRGGGFAGKRPFMSGKTRGRVRNWAATPNPAQLAEDASAETKMARARLPARSSAI